MFDHVELTRCHLERYSVIVLGRQRIGQVILGAGTRHDDALRILGKATKAAALLEVTHGRRLGAAGRIRFVVSARSGVGLAGNIVIDDFELFCVANVTIQAADILVDAVVRSAGNLVPRDLDRGTGGVQVSCHAHNGARLRLARLVFVKSTDLVLENVFVFVGVVRALACLDRFDIGRGRKT